jgi:acyl-CoA thioester hydrolase
MRDTPLATHEMEFRVRYAEVDQMGVVHHSRYAEYFEMGRTELIRSQGVAYRDLEAAGVLIVVVRLEVQFRQPARYDDVLRLVTALQRVTTARIDHSYALYRAADNVLLAEGRSTLASVDRNGELQPLPEGLFGAPQGQSGEQSRA